MNTKNYIQKLVYSFLIVFSFLCISGAMLIFVSINELPASETEAKASVEGTKIDFELKTGIPGIMLTFLGTLGLITLLIKIPVKQAIKTIMSDHGRQDGIRFFLLGRLATRTVYRDLEIPLFLYLVLKNKLSLSYLPNKQ